jgi:hypothetical protein
LLIGPANATGAFAFHGLGGRTAVAGIDGTRVAVLTGTECEKLGEKPLLADRRVSLSDESRQHQLAIMRLDLLGDPHVESQVAFDDCCQEGARLLVVGGADSKARYLAVAHADGRGGLWRVTLFDLRLPLAGQTPARSASVGLSGLATFTAADLDGDGRDEVVVSDTVRGYAFHIVHGDGLATLEPYEL